MLANISFLKVALVLLSLGGFLFTGWTIYDAIGDARETQILYDLQTKENENLRLYIQYVNEIHEIHNREQKEITNDVKKYGDDDIGPVLRNELDRLRSSR